MLRFEHHNDFVEINLASQELENLSAEGDFRLTIRASSNGFTGCNTLWVLAEALSGFCRALMVLERDRQGEAILESMSPEGLRLVLRSVDSCGHMVIKGSTGHEVLHEHTRVWHSVTFGFEFDPSQLVRATATNWVRKNTGVDGTVSGS